VPGSYYFDLVRPGETIRDENGVEAADFEEAVELAQEVIGEMLAQGELPADAGAWRLVVRNADGTQVRELPIP
jgi:hypothetical protein